ALSPSWEADISTTPERFEHQVRLLLKRGYRLVRFTELVEATGPGRLAAITFDDAFLSVFALALPILQRLGVPATLYVPTDYIDTGGLLQWPGIDGWLAGPDEPELTPMSWAQVATLAEAGWEIGSHTGSHPRLTQLNDGALESELTRSKEVCEGRLGASCLSVAYPYGDVDARVAAAAARVGYRTGAALPAKLDGQDPLRWPRIGVYRVDDDRRFRLKVSPVLMGLRRSPAWNVLAATRRLAS
ncbi:MAG TPA: polysaccharide deacetylase family protein, partial [Solirubrobacteraceae bacterium]|nr:polysaccharide deacetylase family protein [Solirubrobacteraceae bacterium]